MSRDVTMAMCVKVIETIVVFLVTLLLHLVFK
jgi:hypothetical protein